MAKDAKAMWRLRIVLKEQEKVLLCEINKLKMRR